jgi:transcriptional regulator with XRE-family HTH domain
MANDLIIFKTDMVASPSLGDITAKIHGLRVAAVNAAKPYIIEIGRELAAAKTMIPHGGWTPYLEREFKWSDRTAQRYMAAAADFDKYAAEDKTDTGVGFARLNIDIAAFYALAASGVPEEAREEAVARAKGGEHISAGKAKAIVQQHRPAAAKGTKASRDWSYHPEKDRNQPTAPGTVVEVPVEYFGPDLHIRLPRGAHSKLCHEATRLALTPERVATKWLIEAIDKLGGASAEAIEAEAVPVVGPVIEATLVPEPPVAPTAKPAAPPPPPPRSRHSECDSLAAEERGSRLHGERKRLGLTQGQLAAKVGLHQTAIGKYEAGLRTLDWGAIQKFAEAGVNINYVMTGKDVEPNPVPAETIEESEAPIPGEVPVTGECADDRVLH